VESKGVARGARKGHPLLGEGRELAERPGTFVWESLVSLDSHSWLRDHRVQGSTIVPASAYAELGLAAGRETFGKGPLSLRNIRYLKPMVLDDGIERILQTTIAVVEQAARFDVYSRVRNCEDHGVVREPWTHHVTMEIASVTSSDSETSQHESIEAIRKRCTSELNVGELYDLLAEKGNQWGPTFRGTQRIWVGEHESIAQVRIPASIDEENEQYFFHPAVGDACGHTLIMMMPVRSVLAGIVGEGIDEVRFYNSARTRSLWSVAKVRDNSGKSNVIVGDLRVYDDGGMLLSELLGVRIRLLETTSERDSEINDWYYAVRWHAEPLTGARVSDRAAGPWLIFADQAGIAKQIASRRSLSGGRTVLVSRGAKWLVEGDRALIRADVPADYAHLLEAIGNPAAIVHLWSLDVASDAADPVDDALRVGAESALHIVHALQGVANNPRARVWWVTSDAQSVVKDDKCDAPWSASLWGLGAALSVEQSELWGGLIDLASVTSAELAADRLINEIGSSSGEDRVAFRGDRRYVPRLVRRPPDARAVGDFSVRSDSTFLIAGGLGGIGLATARWLVGHGARHLLLVSRTPLPARETWSGLEPESTLGQRTRAVASLEALGAEVETAAIDIAIDGDLETFLESRRMRGAPNVCGVIHAAGVLRFKDLATEDAASLRQSLIGKMRGAWRLHRIFLKEPLDFFVMCSSSSALLRSPLLGGYAAGNAFLDALAHYRRGRGLPAISINWGTWGEVGMATESGREASVSGMAKGMSTISTEAGLTALGELLISGDAQTAVMPVNWAEFVQSYPALLTDPFIASILDKPSYANMRSAGSERIPPASQSARKNPAEMMRYLATETARVLGMSPERIDSGLPLSSYGFDSLMAVQLKNRIETDFGAVVPLIQLLQGASIDQVFPNVFEAVQAASLVPATTEHEQLESWEEGIL
jgi:acyl transferase domain-containing protein